MRKTSATLQACAKAPLGAYGLLESYISAILPTQPLSLISLENVFVTLSTNSFNCSSYLALSFLVLLLVANLFNAL